MLRSPDTPARTVEPTFYLEGRPYVYSDQVRLGGEPLARMAFEETADMLASMFVTHHAQPVLSDDEYEHAMVELIHGLWSLRALIPGDEVLYAFAPLVAIH